MDAHCCGGDVVLPERHLTSDRRLPFSDERLVRLRAPAPETLVSLYCKVKAAAAGGASGHYAQHTTVRECLLRRDLADCMCAPTENLRQILFVAPAATLETARWQAACEKYALEVVSRDTVSGAMYCMVLQYSLMVRAAPEWNRLGSGLVQGYDFLASASHGRTRRIELAATWDARRREAVLRMRADRITLPQLGAYEFKEQLAPAAGAGGRLELLDGGRSCVTLPKLSRGTLVAIRKEPPADEQINTYIKMRNYWRDAYSYMLPAVAPRHYYELTFKFGRRHRAADQQPNTLTLAYPPMCVLSGMPMTFRYENNQAIEDAVYALILDLSAKMSNMCGVPFHAASIDRVPAAEPALLHTAAGAPVVDENNNDNGAAGRRHQSTLAQCGWPARKRRSGGGVAVDPDACSQQPRTQPPAKKQQQQHGQGDKVADADAAKCAGPLRAQQNAETTVRKPVPVE